MTDQHLDNAISRLRRMAQRAVDNMVQNDRALFPDEPEEMLKDIPKRYNIDQVARRMFPKFESLLEEKRRRAHERGNYKQDSSGLSCQ